MTDSIVVMSKDDFVDVIESAARQAAAEAVRKMPRVDQPRPLHVNQTQAAEMMGLSTKTVSRMLKSGALTLNAAGLIPISQIDRLAGLD